MHAINGACSYQVRSRHRETCNANAKQAPAISLPIVLTAETTGNHPKCSPPELESEEPLSIFQEVRHAILQISVDQA